MSILSFAIVLVTVQLEQTATSTSPPFHSIFTLPLEILGTVLFMRLPKAPISFPQFSHHANNLTSKKRDLKKLMRKRNNWLIIH